MLTPLRTPQERFANLPDYPFAENYAVVSHPDYDELRMHYVDIGPRAAPVVLMLHGEPSWSFGYRRVIAAVSAAGYRVVAPDHIGFGKSDKLLHVTDYSYQFFVDCMQTLVEQLELQQITLLCQDWGGPIGLRTLSQMPDRFSGLIVANTLLPNAQLPPLGIADWPGELVRNWAATVRDMKDMPVAAIVDGVCVTSLDDDVIAGYDAPFPDASYKAAALAFPPLIPLSETMPGIAENRAAWSILEQLDIPCVTAFSDSDPSTKAWEAVFQSRLPKKAQHLSREISGAGHFVQEDQPGLLAQVVLDLQQFIAESH
ncbi:alpha/beta fold hydrolase [Halieaceae bacterium IMCC14734]|uniref:Alpha/beta fold hydrolase n=1 Tax=Candidatus Litorirhabdus singularis TaxID=2518993 RepID=A0ABT3TEL4_9GAMM|nr:haloalkane dehalogenase [Candidatus Litorirhabdus singularis]MCX2979859.1 alpha/beta fold hydrolase [Candidatus Litorirhabdus singularis]